MFESLERAKLCGAYYQKPGPAQIGCGLLFKVFNTFSNRKLTSEGMNYIVESSAGKSGWGLPSKTLQCTKMVCFIV